MLAYILIGFYGLVASICLGFTLVEGAMSRERGFDLMRVAGLLLSLFWPGIILLLFFSSPRGKRIVASLRDAVRGSHSRPVPVTK